MSPFGGTQLSPAKGCPREGLQGGHPHRTALSGGCDFGVQEAAVDNLSWAGEAACLVAGAQLKPCLAARDGRSSMCSPLAPPTARSRDNRQRLPKRLKTWPKPIPCCGTLAQPPRHNGTLRGRGGPARPCNIRRVRHPSACGGAAPAVARGGMHDPCHPWWRCSSYVVTRWGSTWHPQGPGQESCSLPIAIGMGEAIDLAGRGPARWGGPRGMPAAPSSRNGLEQELMLRKRGVERGAAGCLGSPSCTGTAAVGEKGDAEFKMF